MGHISFSTFAWNVFLSCDEILTHDGYIKYAILLLTLYKDPSELIYKTRDPECW